MRAPEFWYQNSSILSKLLSPLSVIYNGITRWRLSRIKAFEARIPVICVGNLVAGGAGKTPTVRTIIDILQRQNYKPHVLMRGYGGHIKGPVEVGRQAHRISDVGDEALLFSEFVPTWISHHRGKGAKAIQNQGLANVIVMDDGFQNPSLKKDMSIVVVDGKVGFGNGHVLPAGPLREPIASGLSRADAVVIIGEDCADIKKQALQYSTARLFQAELRPDETSNKFKERKVVAFAGIGRPDKFKETLKDIGADIVGWHSFPDHYMYRESDIWKIVDEAADKNAVAVTTEKDFMRLSDAAQKRVDTLTVRLAFEDPETFETFLEDTLKRKSPG